MNTPMCRLRPLRINLGFISVLLSSSCLFFPVHLSADPEKGLLEALDAIQSSNIGKAERVLKTVISDEPEFKLAHMVYADILKARATPLSHAGMGLHNEKQLDDLLDEVRLRYNASQELINDDGKIPAVLSQLDNQHEHAIVVDLKQSRLYLFENNNGTPKRIEDYYVSIGRGGSEKKKEGDLKTPHGVYFIQSFIPPGKLSDKYGAGAYPINYPNELDTFNGLTGSGIWLHGTRSGTYNRAPLASEGCVVLSNDNLIEIGSYITLRKTPVIIGSNIEWLSPDQWIKTAKHASTIFNQWVESWESMDVDDYLSHYSKDFNNGKNSFSRWAKHKRKITKNKKYVQVNATNVSHLQHPNKDVMVTTFHQNYISNNYSSQSWKRQYWKKEGDGKWRIIYENAIERPASTRLAKR